jgi:putative ABC transport system permease protein
LAHDVFKAWFGQDDAWRVAIMLRPGSDVEAVRSRLWQRHPGLAIYTNAHLRRESLRIFHQTFSMTYAMEAIGVIVAVAGLGLALASLLLERREDLHTLRCLGMTSREIASACAIEGGALAACGVAMGLASGLWLGWLLIYRVNKQTFGWTLGFALPMEQLLALGAAVVAAGVSVAALVGTLNSRRPSERLLAE